MSYIGAQPTTAAFVTDQFSGDGSTTVFTMSVAPANTASVIVAVSGVLQDPSTYAVSGTSLTFSGAPPAGTGNISARYLGLPASGVATTAYRTLTEFTATSGQTTFSVPSYTVGFINVYRNGVMLGTADFTATSGTTVVLAAGATAGDLVAAESFFVSGVSNAIPAVAGAVNTSYITDGAVTAAKMAASGAWAPAGTVIQVVSVNGVANTITASTSFIDTDLVVTITPTSSASKIYVVATGGFDNNSSGGQGYATIDRNGTDLGNTTQGFTYVYSSASRMLVPWAASFLDSPATTSSVTYTVQVRANAGTIEFPGGANQKTITVMEIAG